MQSDWRSGWPNRHLMVRQNWMAESKKVWLRPRLPLGAPSHCMSRSSHTVSDPRALTAALYCAQFVVRYLLQFFLSSLMRAAHQLGWADLCNKAYRLQKLRQTTTAISPVRPP